MKSLLAFLALVCALQANSQSDGDARLVDGVTNSSGRVELFYQGEWGTVCDDGFSRAAAGVVCRSAGIRDARPSYFTSPFLTGTTGPILLDDVRCGGDEANLLRCSHRRIGTTNCLHVEDVAVDCYGQDLGKTAELQNGTNTDGVLVVSYAGSSGTVCYDSHWRDEESRVACRMLGYEARNRTAMTIDRSFFGEITDLPVIMSNVQCRGGENDLSGCYRRGRGANNCSHDRDVAIDCLGGDNLEATLANGNGTHGEVQLTYKLTSAPVCEEKLSRNRLNPRSIQVYCRMLGYSRHRGVLLGYNNLTVTNATTGIIYPIRCEGQERNIVECRHRYPLRVGPCSMAAFIACLPQDDVGVRLAEGFGSSTSGRLEVQHEGIWGTVCDDRFNRNAAMVFCRMLNLTYVWHHIQKGIETTAMTRPTLHNKNHIFAGVSLSCKVGPNLGLKRPYAAFPKFYPAALCTAIRTAKKLWSIYNRNAAGLGG